MAQKFKRGEGALWKMPETEAFTAVIIMGEEKDGMVEVMARSAHGGVIHFHAASCDLLELNDRLKHGRPTE